LFIDVLELGGEKSKPDQEIKPNEEDSPREGGHLLAN
jgi:hypothetical protein